MSIPTIENLLKIQRFEQASLGEAVVDPALSISSIDQLAHSIISELKINQLYPNAELKSSIQYVSAIFKQCGFPQNDYHVKGIKDVCFWTSLCFPNACQFTLKMFSLIMSYLSVVDDVCDSEKDVDGYLRSELQQHVNLLKCNSFIDMDQFQENPSICLLQFILKDIKSNLSIENQNKIQQAMIQFYENSILIANMWVNDQKPDLKQYIRLREYDSLAHMLLVLKSVDGNSISSSSSSALYFKLCTHACLICNDICSLPKDVTSGISNNYVLLKNLNDSKEGMEQSLQDLIQILREMKELEEMYRVVSGSGDMEEMKSIVRGYVGWCFKSPRFHHCNHFISSLVKQDDSSSSCITTQRGSPSVVEPITYLDVILVKSRKTAEMVKSSKLTITVVSTLFLILYMIAIVSTTLFGCIECCFLILIVVLSTFFTGGRNTQTMNDTSSQEYPSTHIITTPLNSPGRNVAI